MMTGLLLQAVFGFALSGSFDRFFPNPKAGGNVAGFAVMYGFCKRYKEGVSADGSPRVRRGWAG